MILTTSYLAGLTITPRSVATGYPAANLLDLWHLKRRFRAGNATKSDTDYLLKIDFGTAQTLTAVFLNDVNFDKVRIRGHASDLGNDWSGSTFDSGTLTVLQCPWTARYKILAALSSFNYRHLAIQVPAAAAMVGDYTTMFEIGTLLCLTSTTSLTVSATDYAQTTQQPYVDVGRSGRVVTSSVLGWVGRLTFGARSTSEESELTDINAISYATPILFSDEATTAAAWIVVKDSNYIGTLISPGIVRGSIIRLREIISG